MSALVTAGPSMRRGDMYGGEEGTFSDVQEASGPAEAGPSPALFWVAGLAILIVIRMVWESADKG